MKWCSEANGQQPQTNTRHKDYIFDDIFSEVQMYKIVTTFYWEISNKDIHTATRHSQLSDLTENF